MNKEEYIYTYEELLDLVLKYQKENKELSRMCELYSKSLYNADLKRLEKENQQLKKQKDDIVQYIKEIKKHREGLTITEYKAKWRSMFDYLESNEIINNILRMLGEIDAED